MEVWRAIPAALFGAGGVVAVLVSMAMARDRRGATHLTVVATGLVVLIVVAGLTLAIAGLLPVLVGWGMVFLLAMALLAMMHAH